MTLSGPSVQHLLYDALCLALVARERADREDIALREEAEARKHYFNYKAYKTEKASDDDKLLIWACSKEYEIGFREAKMYLEQMPNEVKEELKSKWEESYKYNKQ